MRAMLLLVVCAVMACAAEPQQLFNGRDLTGWEMAGQGRFVVENGALKTEGGMGLLYFKGRKLGNETLRVVFKAATPNANSGVFIRLPEPPPDAWYGVHNGYEVQIAGSGDEWHSTGAIYSISPSAGRNQKMDDWNMLDIQLDGPLTRIYLNGRRVNFFDPSKPVPERKAWSEPVRGQRPDEGYIGLQNHDADSVVYFREVSVRAAPEIRTPDAGVADRDRGYLLSYYHATRKQLLDALAGLSGEQLHYKPAPDRWSIAEIAEHLVLSEENLPKFALGTLKNPAPAKEPDTPRDEDFLARMRDRSRPAQAPEGFRPTGKWKTADELGAAFRERRDRNIAWLRDTKEPLRDRYAKSPLGELSAYQMFLMVPGHVERHLAQLAEVKASPGFPKR